MLAPESARNYISPEPLKADLEAAPAPDLLLVDVRTPEAFQVRHIAGAVNVCVYEIAFLDNLAKKDSRKSDRIVLYGEGEGYVAPEAALQKLLAEGYENIEIPEGGLSGWSGEVEGEGESSESSLPAGIFPLDAEDSQLCWIGRNLTNQHDGSIALKTGEITVNEEGYPQKSKGIVDMTQMTCRDLQDSPMAKVLIGHLSNQDFFLVDQYPTASISLDSFTPLENTSPGRPNYRASGILTVRGVEQPVELEILVAAGDGQWIVQSEFDLDRTLHGAIYGSARFFEKLGMHLVNDLVYIQTLLFFETAES